MAVAALWTPCNAACTVRALRVHCACTVRTHAPPHERVLRPSVCAHVCVSPFARACLTLKLSATLPSSQRHSPTKWMLQGLLRRFAMLVHNWTCPGVGPRRVSHQGPPSGVSQCSSTTGLVQAWVRGASRTCILTSPERWMLKGHPAFRNARPQLDLSRRGPAARLAPASDKPRKVDAKGPQLDLSRRGPAARLAHAPSSTEQQPVQRPSVKTKCLRLLITHMLLQMIEERLKHNTSESPTFTRLPLVCVCVRMSGLVKFLCRTRARRTHREHTHTHTCVRAHTGRQKKCNTQRTSLQVSPCRIWSCS